MSPEENEKNIRNYVSIHKTEGIAGKSPKYKEAAPLEHSTHNLDFSNIFPLICCSNDLCHFLLKALIFELSQFTQFLAAITDAMRGHDWINTCLPDELVLEIIRRLDSKSSRDACSLVCKRWLCLERLSRATIRIGATGTPDLFVNLLASRFANVRNVHVDERLSISIPVRLVSQPIWISLFSLFLGDYFRNILLDMNEIDWNCLNIYLV